MGHIVKMNHAIKSLRTSPPCVLSSPAKQVGRKTPGVSFRQVTTMAGKPESEQKNKSNDENKDDKNGLVLILGWGLMSRSFGEGYGTRSDEEGFGGIYGGNQSITEAETDVKVDESHPDYDETQGNEVEEKEKARFQTKAGS
ncbi:hypothetical protein POTOM_027994 [Populus tomentosa]|uniref:Uncharacterized protein n=1 Tax=Populus tomentosa TaxID=118781 RepID=A0A8X8CUE4_POPTO|nr:hypothetical protein POTOM_027994 [Populus tomentosa]